MKKKFADLTIGDAFKIPPPDPSDKRPFVTKLHERVFRKTGIDVYGLVLPDGSNPTSHRAKPGMDVLAI